MPAEPQPAEQVYAVFTGEPSREATLWADVTRQPCHAAWLVGRALQPGGWPGAPRPRGPGCHIMLRAS